MKDVVWFLLAAPTAMATNNERTCIKNTGARCLSNCYSWRGPAYCKWSRCFCEEGGCAGADDICHTGASKAMKDIAGGQAYTIRNARWPDFFLRAAWHGPLTAKRMRNKDNEQFKWQLREPPSPDAEKPPGYLIYSKEWPDAVAFIHQGIACSSSNEVDDAGNLTDEQIDDFVNAENNTNNTLPAGYAYPDDDALEGLEYDDPEGLAPDPSGNERRLGSRRRYGGSYGGGGTQCREVRTPLVRNVQGNMGGLGADPPMHWMLNYFVKAPKVHRDASNGAQLVLLKNSQNSYLFMPRYGIYGFTGWGTRGNPLSDPGTGGYWLFDPPLPAEIWDKMPAYSGRTCSIMCGEVSPDLYAFVGAAPSWGSNALLAAWAVCALAVLAQ